MGRHSTANRQRPVWRRVTSMLGIVSMAGAMAVAGTVAFADDPAPSPTTWTVGMSVADAGGTDVNGATVSVRDALTYTLTVTGTPGTPADPNAPVPDSETVSVTADLAGLLSSAALGTLGADLTPSGSSLIWTPTATLDAVTGRYSATTTFTAAVGTAAYGATLATSAALTADSSVSAATSVTVADYTGLVGDYLGLAKTVTANNQSGDGPIEIHPGDSFSYNLRVECQQEPCINATLVDTFPDELNGYSLNGLGGLDAIPHRTEWSTDGGTAWSATMPSTVGSTTLMRIVFLDNLSGTTYTPAAEGATGLLQSRNFNISVSLTAPASASPGTHPEAVNTADITAVNAQPKHDTASTQLVAPVTHAAGLDKTWCTDDVTPCSGTAGAQPGGTSTVTLTATNLSNVAVDKLVIQEPQTAADDAATLDAQNPFRIADLAADGITVTSAPVGADQVTVDAYVWDGTTYVWKTGTATALDALGLPSGVNADDVAGLRITFSSSTGKIDQGASGTVSLSLEQRSQDRNGGATAEIGKYGATVTNRAAAWVVDGTVESEHVHKDAKYQITLPKVEAGAAKDIVGERAGTANPVVVSPGEAITGTITGTNKSSVPVHELKLVDSGFFTADVTFGGFTGITWPEAVAGNTLTGQVVYHFSDSSSSTAGFTDGALPAAPTVPSGAHLTGFDIVFTSANGGQATDGIKIGAASTATFTIGADDGAIRDSAYLNTLTTTVTRVNGLTDSTPATKQMKVVKPAITATIDKSIAKQTPVHAGENVVTTLKGELTTTSGYVTATKLVVTDAWDGTATPPAGQAPADGAFWDAFDLYAIPPLDVPAGMKLVIEVTATAPATDSSWKSLLTQDNTAGAATTVSMTHNEIVDALNTGNAGFTIDKITGIRYTYTGALPADTNVAPSYVATARQYLRSSTTTPGTATSPGSNDPSDVRKYVNQAQIDGYGTPKGGAAGSLHDDDTDTSFAKIIGYPGGGGNGDGSGVYVNKTWNAVSVTAQSGATPSTTLSWRVWGNYDSVAISDPNGTPVANGTGTAFDVFDLTGIAPLSVSDTPYSNGWYLKYDTVDKVELYYSVGGAAADWHAIDAPGGSWQKADRSFKGLTISDAKVGGTALTPAEIATVVGVRITVVPDDVARTAVEGNPGSADFSFVPPSGSGVANGARSFNLNWQLRNKTRSADAVISADGTYNGGVATVKNTVGIAACKPAGGNQTCDTDDSDDTIQIVNQPPNVSVTKTAKGPGTAASSSSNPFLVPSDGGYDASSQKVTFTLTANSTASSRASYVRVMDPMPCAGSADVTNCESPATEAGATGNPFVLSGRDWLTDAAFDRFDVTKISFTSSIASQVDMAQSTVWLLTYSGGTYHAYSTDAAALTGKTGTVSATPAGGGTAESVSLSDVVGLSVAFKGIGTDGSGTITSGNNFAVTIDGTLRSTLRSTGATFSMKTNETTLTVSNTVFAQSYDLVLYSETQCSTNGPRQSGQCRTGDTDAKDVYFSGGSLKVGATKTITGTDDSGTDAKMYEPHRNGDVTVDLAGNSNGSSLAPTSVVLTDDDAAFWNEFDLVSLGAVSPPGAADRVAVDLYGPFGTGGAMAWTASTATPIADAALPAAVDVSQATGIRFTFTKDGGGYLTTDVTAPAWTAAAKLTVHLRDTYRADAGAVKAGDAIVMDHSVADTLTVDSWRCLVPATGAPSADTCAKATAPAADSISLGSGTAKLKISKVAQQGTSHWAKAGDQVRWDITLVNAGNSYLDVTQLTDELPSYLAYLPDSDSHKPQFSTDGTLGGSTGAMNVALAADGSTVTFTWPDGSRMEPGEKAVITLWLEMQPVASGIQVVNTAVATTVQRLESCELNGSAGTLAGDYGANWDHTSCGAQDYVQAVDEDNLFSRKGVDGSLDGAVNPVTGDACAPTIHDPSAAPADPAKYYPVPCVANSAIDGVDDWVLHVVNAGTKNIDKMVLFDQLPVPGDRMLIDAARGTDFRPQLVAAVNDGNVFAPAGTGIEVEATTSDDVCTNGGASTPGLTTACNSNGEVWKSAAAVTDWSAVTGLRITLDFTTTSAKTLKPGQQVDVKYSTENIPSQDSGDSRGLDVSQPVLGKLAWNQFGTFYQLQGQSSWLRSIGNKVGVRLMNPTVVVKKTSIGGTGTFSFTLTPVQRQGVGVTRDVTTSGDNSSATGTAQWDNLEPGGLYELTESSASGWTQSFEGCTVDPQDATWSASAPSQGLGAQFYVPAGSVVTCSFTNTRIPTTTPPTEPPTTPPATTTPSTVPPTTSTTVEVSGSSSSVNPSNGTSSSDIEVLPSSEDIAYTGVNAFGMGALALLLLALGGGLLWAGKAGRRRRVQH